MTKSHSTSFKGRGAGDSARKRRGDRRYALIVPEIVEYIFEELENAIVAGTEDVFENAEAVLDVIGPAGAAEIRIGGECG